MTHKDSDRASVRHTGARTISLFRPLTPHTVHRNAEATTHPHHLTARYVQPNVTIMQQPGGPVSDILLQLLLLYAKSSRFRGPFRADWKSTVPHCSQLCPPFTLPTNRARITKTWPDRNPTRCPSTLTPALTRQALTTTRTPLSTMSR